MSTTYKNPWHKPGKPEYGPAMYETDATPKSHAGYLIFHRFPIFDVVKDGVCITQRAGPNGAKRAAEQLAAGTYMYGYRPQVAA